MKMIALGMLETYGQVGARETAVDAGAAAERVSNLVPRDGIPRPPSELCGILPTL